ncbi:MAG: helix-turn-helix domain-containing protein [Steroidobacteraceae bacterium]
MKDITIKTAGALGLQLRARRLAIGLSQAALAQRVGVERKWIVRLEAGNDTAEFDSVLRTLEALNCDLILHPRATHPRPAHPSGALDEVFNQLKTQKTP